MSDTNDNSPSKDKVETKAESEVDDVEDKKDNKTDKKEDQDKSSEETSTNDQSKDNDSEGDSEEEDEEKVGMYDEPLVLETGRKRERKKVDRLSFKSPPTEEKKFEVAKGKGEKLGDMPFVDFKLNKYKVDELKILHRILFKRVGTHSEIKKNIRLFSGFTFSKTDDEYEKRLNSLKSKQYTMAMIKQICDVLDVQRGGSKDEVVERLMEFLMKPTDSGRKVPKPKRKRSSKGGKEKSKKSKKDQKEKKSKKEKKAKADDENEEDEDNESDENDDEEHVEEEEDTEDKEDEDEESESEEEEEEEEAPPKKKKRVSSPKKPVEKKKKEKTKAKTPKKTPQKKIKKKVESEEDISDTSSEDDDEPLVKQKKTGPPTNDELKKDIKKLLDSANLEEVTMKTVLKQVYAKYPSFDLSDRKDFIKSTVKKIIS